MQPNASKYPNNVCNSAIATIAPIYICNKYNTDFKMKIIDLDLYQKPECQSTDSINLMEDHYKVQIPQFCQQHLEIDPFPK